KGDRNAVLDSDVVLTKMKLLNNFNEKFRSTENSTLSAAPVSEHDTPDPGEASEVNSHPEDKSGMDSGAGYLPGIFSDSHLSRLYKFESEDSGVELPSGANSPSTPTGSEKSFAVHSRESSCHCCNLDSDSTSSPDALATEDQNSKEANGLKNSTNSTQAQQQRSSALGSGLGYLEHICQLLEKIARLQEANVRLQRQVCSLQRDGRMRKTKERYCSCGSATLAFQNWQSKSDFPSPSGTSSDLSTIPEVGWHPLLSARKWRRSQNQRSYAEREPHHHGDGTELSENYMWGRVKDLVRKSKGKNQSGLGLMSASLKLSCPQLYNRNSMIVLG
uniref:DUF4657 domain-containing protein n=1 Tax=Xiphophorus couchianus TaxID=32473 RepID=A0A3B5M4R7_9TELE